ncbi:MAG: hypothetical protein AAB562_00615 [Patescibacteria group bacterium]
MSWLKDEKFKVADPRKMSFTFREWLWGLWAFIRFWNKKFRAPYCNMTVRQALILMRLRNERLATFPEALAILRMRPLDPAPYLWWDGSAGLKFGWAHEPWGPSYRFLVFRK